jgi:hypothetical protein
MWVPKSTPKAKSHPDKRTLPAKRIEGSQANLRPYFE